MMVVADTKKIQNNFFKRLYEYGSMVRCPVVQRTCRGDDYSYNRMENVLRAPSCLINLRRDISATGDGGERRSQPL